MRKQDYSISMLTANVASLLIAIPLVVGLGALYALRWSGQNVAVSEGWQVSQVTEAIIFVGVFLVGIVVHELIHALTWMAAGRKPWSAIRFGISWKTLSPFAHCLEPMDVNAYRIGALMPGLLMGLLPTLAAIVLGNGFLMTFGLLFTFTAGGDFLVLWLLRKVPAGRLVEDHPTRAGCIVLEGA